MRDGGSGEGEDRIESNRKYVSMFSYYSKIKSRISVSNFKSKNKGNLNICRLHQLPTHAHTPPTIYLLSEDVKRLKQLFSQLTGVVSFFCDEIGQVFLLYCWKIKTESLIILSFSMAHIAWQNFFVFLWILLE